MINWLLFLIMSWGLETDETLGEKVHQYVDSYKPSLPCFLWVGAQMLSILWLKPFMFPGVQGPAVFFTTTCLEIWGSLLVSFSCYWL